jgi:hypothetical protein
MLLSELKIFPTKQGATFSEALKELLDKHGMQAFQGGQATVLDRGSYVWRAWFDDPGYERFLAYVAKHPGSKHLPKLLSRVREEAVQFSKMPKGKTIKYIKLEKLAEAPLDDLVDAINAIDMAQLLQAKVPETVEQLAELMLTLKPPADSEATPAELKAAVLKQPEFFKVVLDLMQHQANDINSGNVMFRGVTPVVIDPFKD